MQIKYYLNFNEEKRRSMEIYANQLVDYLKKNYNEFDVQSFRPKLDFVSSLIFFENTKMQYARYISYPKQIKNIPKHDIAHICDHQYTHLYSSLNSKVKFVTVHDLVPFVFRKKIGRWRYLLQYSLSKLKYYDKVFTVSENTKKDILKYTDCPEKKIEVIMEVVEPYFNISKIDESKVCKMYNLPKEKKKILISGNIFYKNHLTLFKTLEKLITQDKDIVFVKIGGKFDINHFKHLKNIVYELPFLHREELPKIYKVCKLLFFPSIYEGFGLPLLEAMQCGIPIVCSNNSSIPEVVGNTAIKNDHNNIEGFVKDILSLLNNKKLYSLKRQEALDRTKIFDISKFHNRLIDIYRTELSKSG